MEDKIIAVRFDKKEYNKIKQYIREKSAKDGKDISLSDFVRESVKREAKIDGKV